MRKKLSVIVLAVVVLTFMIGLSNAMAFGLGFYGEGSASKANLTYEAKNSYPPMPEETYKKKSDHLSFGLVLDSAVAKDRVFNYRLQIGYDQFKLKPGDGTAAFDLQGIVLDNDFGIGIVRAESVRLWVGPELRFTFLMGDDKNSGVTVRDASLGGVGIGPVLGLNINIGKAIALSLKGGYLFNSYSGKGDGKYVGGKYQPDADYTLKENTPVASFAVIFRIGDD